MASCMPLVDNIIVSPILANEEGGLGRAIVGAPGRVFNNGTAFASGSSTQELGARYGSAQWGRRGGEQVYLIVS